MNQPSLKTENAAPGTTPNAAQPLGSAELDAADAPGVRGVTRRVVVLSLLLAVLFGYCIPIVDFKFSNTFLGAAHLPAAAVAVLLALLLLLNPLLHWATERAGQGRALLGGAFGCGLSALGLYFFNDKISAKLAPAHEVIALLLLVVGVAALVNFVRLERKVFLWGLLAIAAALGAHYQADAARWSSLLVILAWFLVAAAVLLFAAFFMRQPLSRNEVLTVYITCLFSALVPGRGGENFFIPNILAPFYFATRENKWIDFFLTKVQWWFTPARKPNGDYNGPLVESWYTGLRAGENIPWGLWLVPLIAWSLLILAVYGMLGCLGVMLRAQWAEREALAFPLLRLPMQMTEDMDETGSSSGRLLGFFQNPIMWVGFGIAVFIEMLNGLHFFYPEVPEFPLSLATGPLFSEAPWNQIGNMDLKVYPAIVGISYLLTSEVSFSLWFIYLFTKVQLIIAYSLGFPPNSMPTPFWTRGWAKGFIGYQQIGAYFAYVALLVWLGRKHFHHIFLRAIKKADPTPAEANEALSYPAAFWGFVGTLTFVILWTWAAGVDLPLSILLWGSYLVVAMGLTRIVAEGGLMFVHTGWMTLGPLAFLFGAGKDKLISAANAAPASIVSGSIMFEMRGFLLPSFVQGMKLAHDRKIAMRPLMGLIAAVTVVSFFVSIWMIVKLGYDNGGLQLQKWWATAAAPQSAVHTVGISKGIDENFLANWGWVGTGALMTWGMMAARSRFLWFPLHPIGLLMCVPFAMFTMWVSIMLGWLAKTMISRYGGTDTYRKLVPGFLGLALGDIVMVVFWVIIDAWQGRQNHSLLPF